MGLVHFIEIRETTKSVNPLAKTACWRYNEAEVQTRHI